MIAIHEKCNRWLEVSAHYDTHNREPVFHVNDEPRATCPICFYPLNFTSLHPPRSFDELTADETKAGIIPVTIAKEIFA